MSSSKSSLSSSEPAAEPFAACLQDVVCRVEIVLGTGAVSVKDCLTLRRDTVLRLTQAAGSDLQVLVNGIAVALGEVVIVNDRTAIRVTDLLPPPSGSHAA